MAENNSGKIPEEFLADTDNKNFNSFFNYIVSNSVETQENPVNHARMKQNEDGVYERYSGGIMGTIISGMQKQQKTGEEVEQADNEVEDVDGELEGFVLEEDDDGEE